MGKLNFIQSFILARKLRKSLEHQKQQNLNAFMQGLQKGLEMTKENEEEK